MNKYVKDLILYSTNQDRLVDDDDVPSYIFVVLEQPFSIGSTEWKAGSIFIVAASSARVITTHHPYNFRPHGMGAVYSYYRRVEDAVIRSEMLIKIELDIMKSKAKS